MGPTACTGQMLVEEEVSLPSVWEAAGRSLLPTLSRGCLGRCRAVEPPGPRRDCKGAVLVGPPMAPGVPLEARAQGEAAPGGTPEALGPESHALGGAANHQRIPGYLEIAPTIWGQAEWTQGWATLRHTLEGVGRAHVWLVSVTASAKGRVPEGSACAGPHLPGQATLAFGPAWPSHTEGPQPLASMLLLCEGLVSEQNNIKT